MKLFHVADNKPVQIGDTVQRVDGAVGKVRGWEYPQAEGDTGSAIIRFGGLDPAINVEPAMLNLQWRDAAPDTQLVTFDKVKREMFRAAFADAAKLGKKTFVFEEHEYLVDYAYFLLQYLDAKL